MKVLITGAAGFIGFHLSKKLLDKKSNVIGLDNINSYYDVKLKKDRLKQLGIINLNSSINKEISSKKIPWFSFYKTDINNFSELKKIFKKHNFSHVIHLAAQAGVRYSISNPDVYVKTNITGFFNVIELCKLYKIKHLIYASSSSVYGNSSNIPFSETENVNFPESIYAATKKSNELISYSYSKLYGLKTSALRFFTVYGPWGRPDMAPMLFAKAICSEENISVFNNGNLSRDFSYIDDITEGIKIVLDKSDLGDNYEIYNIGFGNPVKLLDFIKILEHKLNKKVKMDMLPMQKGDVNITWSNTKKLEKLGYKPKTDLDTGLSIFVDWYKKYYKI